MSKFHTDPAAMEPMMPKIGDLELGELSAQILRASGVLCGRLPEITSRSVAEILRFTNCYYSNLIEGHTTLPTDIARAMIGDYSSEPKKRDLQLEARAHVIVQEAMEARLRDEPQLNVFSKEFLCWIHREFYKNLPEEFLTVRNPETGRVLRVIPGAIRECDVKVGAHIAPSHKALDFYLRRFSEVYGSARITASRRIVVIAAAHHRLAWIHPFLDGNGRVVRLFAYALAIKNGICGQGMWSISRGLARTKDEYYAALNNADRERESDTDGRGHLSERRLLEFCTYFLSQMLDQMEYMHSLIRPGTLERQIEIYVESRNLFPKHRESALRLLNEALTQGEFQRGYASAITGKSSSHARTILSKVLNEGLLVSDTPKAKVRLAFPMKVLDVYFPALFPLIQRN